ncbi:hypothetical protein AGMMS49546_25520 [Spirochaetia bacterium]|nr:hypothetical protein AGMMS49546_25520 [Spirochaetia bacterium]
MEKLRMGVLGCSGHYALRVATPLRASLLIEPYAVASRDAAKAQAFAGKWGFEVSYGSYEALIADPKVDFIYNPLPNHLHLEYIKKAADAGKPMLCEKPLCLNAGGVTLPIRLSVQPFLRLRIPLLFLRLQFRPKTDCFHSSACF